MKILCLFFIQLLIAILFASTLFAQFSKVNYNNENFPELLINQVDQYDFSTIVHFSYKTISSLKFSGSEDIILIQNGKKLKLLNSFNLPLDNKKHIFNDYGDKLNFSLEFEKLDSVGLPFSIKSNKVNKFNFDNILVESENISNFIDVDSYVGETPSREFFIFYNEGYPVLKYTYKGILLAVKLLKKNEYGVYYQPQIIVQNYTNNDFLLDPSKVYAQYHYSGKYYNAKIYTDKEFSVLVKKKMSSDRFWQGLAEGIASVGAGFSFASGSSNTYITAAGKSMNYGFFGNNLYGNANVNTMSAEIQNTTSAKSYNGMNTFLASQYAKQNMLNLKAQQVDKLNALQGGYIKLNSIFPNSEYTGYTNILYSKEADSFLMKIELNNEEFFFEWDKGMLSRLND